MDMEFLDSVMGSEEGVGKVDEFTGQLWRGWKALRDETVQVCDDCARPPVVLTDLPPAPPLRDLSIGLPIALFSGEGTVLEAGRI